MDVTPLGACPDCPSAAGLPLVRENRAYQLLLQPGGHLEPDDTILMGAALRELTEETGIDPRLVTPTCQHPVYIEYGRVPARPDIGEPAHFHLDFGYSFVTRGEIGLIQESEVRGAGWYPRATAERLVGPRIARAADPAAPPMRSR